MGDEGSTALEAVTRQQPVKTEQTVVNCRMCELAIALYVLVVTMCNFSMQTPSLVTHTYDSIFTLQGFRRRNEV
jgi:hypothetical protein